MNQPPYPPGPPGQPYSGQPYPMQPQPMQPPPPQKKGKSTCLVVGLVLLAISVPVLITVGVLAIYGVRRYLAAAKTAEAKNTVGAIARAAVAAYEREGYSGGLVAAPGKPTEALHQLCKSSTRVPAVPPAGAKYQPSSADGADYNTGDATTGWKCLRFALNQPTYYSYKYETGVGTGKSGATARGFEATAQGDLDGNGVHSLFARGADLRNGAVVLSTELYIENEFE